MHSIQVRVYFIYFIISFISLFLFYYFYFIIFIHFIIMLIYHFCIFSVKMHIVKHCSTAIGFLIFFLFYDW